MSKTNKFIFIALLVVAWLIFVGLSIEAGGLIVNFCFSVFKPEVVGKLYQKLDLSEMYQQSPVVFYRIYSFILGIAILKSILFYYVVMLLHKLDLAKPFSTFVSNQILQISYYTFSIGIISYIARQTTNNLAHKGFEIDKLSQFWVDSEAFILMSAVIYIIGTIFKKGIEVQNENDLTI